MEFIGSVVQVAAESSDSMYLGRDWWCSGAAGTFFGLVRSDVTS